MHHIPQKKARGRQLPQKNYVPRHTNYTNQTNNSSDPSLYSMHSCQTNMSDYSGNTNIIHQRYNIMQRIGEGSFGRVYLAYDMKNNCEVAIKTESKENRYPMLTLEASFLKKLSPCNGKYNGIPYMVEFFQTQHHHMLAMQNLGPSIDNIFRKHNKHFGLRSLCSLAIQMINVIEYIHSCGIIHRDLKPENFLVGVGKQECMLYLIDFGLSKCFMDDNNKHIPYRTKCSFKGTPRYCSTNNHNGIEQSRRDDLESIAYILIYLAKRGTLPWIGIQKPSSSVAQKYAYIGLKKSTVCPESLCSGIDPCFLTYLTYVKSLSFYQLPDYAFMKNVFVEALQRNGFPVDIKLNWEDHDVNNGTIVSPMALQTENNYQKHEIKEQPRNNHFSYNPKWTPNHPIMNVKYQ